ncbi:hypothetical protein BJX63DRAFT_150393 [Aspergillus granulosus]|uniref:Uncharacterized protein n=1 Tax=Aspergillus granulosus TaxID=176169 RepID=A0ABR4HN74_9EURO
MEFTDYWKYEKKLSASTSLQVESIIENQSWYTPYKLISYKVMEALNRQNVI